MDHIFWCIGHRLILPNIVRGEGCFLYDSQGHKYLDLESGVWCTPLGHSHPQVNQALKVQIDRITHTGFCYAAPALESTAQKVLDLIGLSDGKCIFLSSGSEAVEFGVQTLRAVSGKPLLLTLADSFLGSYGSAGKKNKDEWFLFDWTPCTECPQALGCDPNCDHLSTIPFDQVGGFVFEPGSASGLVRFPPRALIHRLTDRVRQQGGIVHINEVTTGFGRTGKWFGFQHYGIGPDIVSLGKGLGNGYPVSAIAMSFKIADCLNRRPFHYSQSHQNDPLGCAAAEAVISALQKDNLVEKSAQAGSYLLDQLRQLKKAHAVVADIRGRGMMIAIEFNPGVENDAIRTLHEKLIQNGYIVAKRPGLNVLRLDPPLIITKESIDAFLTCFNQLLEIISN